MRSSGILSAVFHGALFLLAHFGLSELFTGPPVSATIIPVELVSIAAITAAPQETAPEPEPKPQPEPPPQAPPPPPPPEPLPPLPAPEPEVAALPPEPQPEPAPKPEPKPEAKPELAPPPKPKPDPPAHAAPRTKPKPPVRRDFTNVLKDLAAKERERPAPKTKTVKATVPEGPATPRQTAKSRDKATIAERDAYREIIRRSVEPCWSPPVGAQEANDLIVTLRLQLDPTGRVMRATIQNTGRIVADRFYQAAADSARRAVLNDLCNTFALPVDKYDDWREITLNFDPREMLGYR